MKNKNSQEVQKRIFNEIFDLPNNSYLKTALAVGIDSLESNKSPDDKGLRKIANHYGLEAQKEKTIEELEELIEAIKKNDTENMIEEMADVTIMIYQLNYLNKSFSKCNEIIKFKIERTLNKIEKGL